MNLSQNGAVLENHEISAINSKIGEMGIYQANLREIMRDANRLTYTDITGQTYKGFVNIIQAQRRGMISSDVLDTAKYANIYNRIRTAYSEAKRVAENNLDETMLAGIRAREYDKQNSDRNQKIGNIDQVKEDAYPDYILQNK